MSEKADRLISEALRRKLGRELWKAMVNIPPESRNDFATLVEQAVELGVKAKKIPQGHQGDTLIFLKRAIEFGLMTEKKIGKLKETGQWPDEVIQETEP